MTSDNTQASVQTSGRDMMVPARFWHELIESFRQPDFWAMSSWLDIIVRARKSRLGILWLTASSVIYIYGMGLYFISMGTAGTEVTAGEYLAHVALGAVIFRTLMSTIITSANVFIGSQAFILDGHTRMTDYLLKALAKAFFDMCMYIPAVLVAVWLAGGVEPMGVLLALPTLILLYLNALWIAAVFGVLGARFPDVGQFLGTISIFFFLLTPIIWYPAMMPEGSLRGMLMRFNPLYHFVELFRAPLLGIPVEPGTLWYVTVFTVAGLALSTIVYRRYARYVPLWI